VHNRHLKEKPQNRGKVTIRVIFLVKIITTVRVRSWVMIMVRVRLRTFVLSLTLSMLSMLLTVL